MGSQSSNGSYPNSGSQGGPPSMPCPYHTRTLHHPIHIHHGPNSMTPMGRFINAAPSEGPMILGQPLNVAIPTRKDCTCMQVSDADMDALTRAAILALGDMSGTQFEGR